MSTETIFRGDHEKLRTTLTVLPDDSDETLVSAEEIQWFLTDRQGTGRGERVIVKDDADVTVVDGTTFEVTLTPAETEGLSLRLHYAEVTVTWDGDPSTAELTPAIRVRDTSHRQHED